MLPIHFDLYRFGHEIAAVIPLILDGQASVAMINVMVQFPPIGLLGSKEEFLLEYSYV
jgi:hypothetical protein